jgi:hypothetical protein
MIWHNADADCDVIRYIGCDIVGCQGKLIGDNCCWGGERWKGNFVVIKSGWDELLSNCGRWEFCSGSSSVGKCVTGTYIESDDVIEWLRDDDDSENESVSSAVCNWVSETLCRESLRWTCQEYADNQASTDKTRRPPSVCWNCVIIVFRMLTYYSVLSTHYYCNYCYYCFCAEQNLLQYKNIAQRFTVRWAWKRFWCLCADSDRCTHRNMYSKPAQEMDVFACLRMLCWSCDGSKPRYCLLSGG